MTEQTSIDHLKGDLQAHFEQEHGYPLSLEFLAFKPIPKEKALFEVKISKEGTFIGRYHGVAGYLNQKFVITELSHMDTSPV